MSMRAVACSLLLAGWLGAPTPAWAETIGRNRPAQALTAERIATLPAAERRVWAEYLRRSQAQMHADRASLAAELRGSPAPPPPLAVRGGEGAMPLDRDAAWYGSPEARRMAATIMSFQTPAGGWSKNQNRAGAPRLPGQRYANDAETMNPDPRNFDAPRDRFWTFVGTLDNGATHTEMRFLARVAAQAPGPSGDAYRASFLRGVRYLLDAQLPNGCWPQNWPLEGGFHDAATFNDNATAEAATLLGEVGEGAPNFRFVPAATRKEAAASARKAVDCILRAQVVVNGRRTAWPQQADPLTLQPTSARNYEPRSLASAESAEVLIFLMRQPRPSAAIRAAVADGIAWLNSKAIYGQAFKMTERGRLLVPEAGAGPLWSRNYDIVSGKPIFGDVDQSIHDDVSEISLERRNGYSWYTPAPQKAIERFEVWSRGGS